ncbi:MAG: Spy/CpxP family protein refolding chaperone [Gammaproteobacteria bacterium]
MSTSLADTPKSTDQNNNDQATYPYGMPGGMMGPGYMGGRGMGPGNMPYRGRGPGYMHPGGHGYGGMGYGMGMMQALHLDKSQRSKIRALMREQRATNCKTMTEMMDVRDELAEEYDKDKPNAKAIGKLYEKMQAMQRHMLERMVVTRNKMRDVLNKEQRENFDHMFQGGMGMMNMMGGMMGYGGRGMMNMMGYGGMGYGGMMGYGGWNREE